MFSWFPIFFPLGKPVEVHPDSPLEVHFWRCCGSLRFGMNGRCLRLLHRRCTTPMAVPTGLAFRIKGY
ncbi:hypothetical protein F2Q68_00029132 [Brassica cretica]|uniref:PRMT5 oligomerisation domain-containing protein n=1 Tax=Brassica cretica TaxID=69181 RepID=A0A8S9G847_BRACR|nr:hypothetical protein F2Q68_00029132 [Brassica cretica]